MNITVAGIPVELVRKRMKNMYLRVNITYNNARGYDNTTSSVTSEITGTAQDYLNRYAPLFWQGKNLTAMAGFSFGF